MIGIYVGLGIGVGTLVALFIGLNSNQKGHSIGYYTYLANNGCPPPSINDHLTESMLKYLDR